MGTGPLVRYQERLRTSLRAAFSEDHPPHLIALSFAFGIFMTALPNLGTALIVLAAVGYWFTWASRIAFFAAVLVMNPVVKGGVYVASYSLGRLILGPVSDITSGDVSLYAGRAVVIRLLLGNTILAIVFAIIAYAVALYGVRTYRQ